MSNQNVEGTGFNGENDDDADQETEFSKWMISNGAKPKLIRALIQNEYDSIDVLRQLKGKDDMIAAVAKECQLKLSQQLKLAAIIEKIPSENLYNIVDTAEHEAVLNIDKKLKSIQESMKLVQNTQNNIDDEVKKGKEFIEKSFKDIYVSLDKRKQELMGELDKIANDKKNELNKEYEILNQHSQNAQKKSSDSHQSLRKPLELQEIEKRKKILLNAAKEIENIKVIENNNPLITNYSINIQCDPSELNEAINNFISICSVSIPILVSLKDNKNSSVDVVWKLNKNQSQNNINNYDTKIKIEWTQNESKDDDEDDMKIEWNNNKIFSLNDNNNNGSTENIKISKLNSNYLFRILYFNSKQWSKSSNIGSIFVENPPFETPDEWDADNIGQYTRLDADNRTVIQTKDGHGSNLLSKIVESGTHRWKFKILHAVQNWFLIGIWKINSGNNTKIKWFTDGGENAGYGFISSEGFLTGKTGSWGGIQYAVKVKTGDVVEMVLDMDLLQLKYIINDVDYGNAFSVARTKYRAAVDMYDVDSKVQLL